MPPIIGMRGLSSFVKPACGLMDRLHRGASAIASGGSSLSLIDSTRTAQDTSGSLSVKPQQNRIRFTLSGQRYSVQRQVSRRLTLELPIKQRLPKSPLIVVAAARVPSDGANHNLTFTIMRRRNSVSGVGAHLRMRKKGDLHESSCNLARRVPDPFPSRDRLRRRRGRSNWLYLGRLGHWRDR